MSVKSSVFASKSEQANFYKLSRTWGESHRIYHNLPFLSIFELDQLVEPEKFQPLKLTDTEISRLKKTSVDFTLCETETDRPLLCIEFDGLQQGFNVGTTYYPKTPIPDRWRQQITELKLRVAYGSFFPFFVVSSHEFGDVSQNTALTIVDGIIGTVLSTKAAGDRIYSFTPDDLSLSQEEFDALSAWERQELLQDWVIGVEVEVELENNPLDRYRWSLSLDALGVSSYSVKPLADPDIDQIAPLPTNVPIPLLEPESVKSRLLAFDSIRRIGVEVTLHSRNHGDISAVAWIPNYQAVGFSGYSLVEDIAYVLAAEKLLRYKKQPDSS